METFYNTVQIHSHCGYLSSDQYETECLRILEENNAELES